MSVAVEGRRERDCVCGSRWVGCLINFQFTVTAAHTNSCFYFSPPFSFFHPSVQWSQQLVALVCEHNRRMGDTMGSNRGNRHEHSDGQQQGQNDGEHGREKSKCEHDGEIGKSVDGDCG
jgi:hypothetical protein